MSKLAAWFGARSIRFKLTLAFAGAAAVLLGGLALLLFTSFESGLDGGINRSLSARAAELHALAREAGPAGVDHLPLARSSGSFAEILSARGAVLDRTPSLPRRALIDGQVVGAALASGTPVDAGANRLLVRALPSSDGAVLVVGVSLAQRNHALTLLGDLLFIGGPLMLLLASGAAYWLAAGALVPVERMRRRAAEISGGEPDARLPVPRSHDVVSRLGETLNEMLERIAGAVERERALVSHASHELRTPLAVLKLELELALEPGRSRAEMAAALGSAAEEVDRLTRLASDLLVVARADQGQLPVRPAEIDLRQAVRAIGERFDRIARPQARSVSVKERGELSARVDPDRLEQALDNLLANGLRYGAGEVEIEAREAGALVEVHVRDHGPGFPAEFLPHAFEPFTRADPARSGEAAGLGLSIVRAIAEAHGGSAGAENREGGGAHVWIALPRESRARDGLEALAPGGLARA